MKWFLAIFLSFSLVFLAIFGVNCVYAYFFPIKFQEEIEFASSECGVGQAVIFSVINIESHFNKYVVSPKGAVGLMQVMPSTAEALAKELGTKDVNSENAELDEIFDENGKINLKNPKINIYFGTKYLAQMLARFDNLDTALCAYNAGPTTVKNWLSNEQYSSDGKTLKKIPYEETRNYLKKFHTNYRYYLSKCR